LISSTWKSNSNTAAGVDTSTIHLLVLAVVRLAAKATDKWIVYMAGAVHDTRTTLGAGRHAAQLNAT
jgi:hypothetical protein